MVALHPYKRTRGQSIFLVTVFLFEHNTTSTLPYQDSSIPVIHGSLIFHFHLLCPQRISGHFSYNLIGRGNQRTIFVGCHRVLATNSEVFVSLSPRVTTHSPNHQDRVESSRTTHPSPLVTPLSASSQTETAGECEMDTTNEGKAYCGTTQVRCSLCFSLFRQRVTFSRL